MGIIKFQLIEVNNSSGTYGTVVKESEFMIYLSTGGFSKKTFLQTADLFSNDIIKGLELSAGLYTETLEEDLLLVKKKFDVALHNYFPVPKEPFVFNLASFDEEVLRASMSHAEKAIKTAKECGSNYFSFHAGFLIDPQVSELGKKIKVKKINDRQDSLEHFIKNVNTLANYANKYDVTLLIENNVISKLNYGSFGCNPLLMTSCDETEYIFERVPKNVKLLIDVAHLKVSANTLRFDPVNYIKNFSELTQAYHISDNNGLEDSNEPFSADSWFVRHLRKDLNYYSLEIYVSDIEVLENQYTLLFNLLRA